MITDASVYGSAAILKLADACVGNDTGMVNVAAAVDTRTYVLMGSRPALDHDRAHMTMVNAPSLSELPVTQVVAMLKGSRN